MTNHHHSSSDTTTSLQQLFRIGSAPVAIGELRAPAGSFNRQEIEPLLEKGLIEFDTRTGIAFQTANEWDLIPTEVGLQVLRQPIRQE